jgi:hypothetical protein
LRLSVRHTWIVNTTARPERETPDYIIPHNRIGAGCSVPPGYSIDMGGAR